MVRGRNADMQAAERMQTPRRLRTHAAGWYRLVSWLFARQGVSEVVATRIRFNASPEAVWNHIMFYEEVPGRPAFLLRALLPYPVRTEGDKTRVGATVRCAYSGGDLVKRITHVEPPHLLQFEVIEQRLGIEGCILTRGGSYQISMRGEASDVVLITNYRAYLRPRYLWRPLEALLVSQLHNHILRGVRAAVLPRKSSHSPGCCGIPRTTVRPSRRCCVHSIAIVFPPLVVIRASVAAVWLYEGLWCKILGRVQSQVEVVTAVPRLGPRFGARFPQDARHRGGRDRRVGDGRELLRACVRSCRRRCSSCSMRTDSCGRATSSTIPPAWWSRTSPSSCWSGCAVPSPGGRP